MKFCIIDNKNINTYYLVIYTAFTHIRSFILVEKELSIV